MLYVHKSICRIVRTKTVIHWNDSGTRLYYNGHDRILRMPDGKANVDRGGATFDNSLYTPLGHTNGEWGVVVLKCFFQAHSTGGNYKVDAIESRGVHFINPVIFGQG